MSSATELARFMASTDRRLSSLERASQLGKSSVEVDGQTIPVASGIAAGVTAAATANEARAAAEQAYDAAHNITADQLADGAVTFGKIAAGAVGAVALQADAIDGLVITGTTLRTAASGPGATIKPGASTAGYGDAVIQLSSGATAEKSPGELVATTNGAYSSLNILGPANTSDLSQSARPLVALARHATLGNQISLVSDYIRIDADNFGIVGTSPNSTVTISAPLTVGSPIRLSDSDWVTPSMSGGWTNFGSGYETCSYRLMPDGSVRLRGLVKGGSVSGSTLYPIFTLPAGYRPAAGQILLGAASGGIADVRVLAGGEVCVFGYFAGGTNASVSLAMISFMPA